MLGADALEANQTLTFTLRFHCIGSQQSRLRWRLKRMPYLLNIRGNAIPVFRTKQKKR